MMEQERILIERVLAAYGVQCQVATRPMSYQTSRNNVHVVNFSAGQTLERVTRLETVIEEHLSRERGDTQIRFLYRPFSIVVPRLDPQRVYLREVLQNTSRATADTLLLTLGEYFPHNAPDRQRKWLRVDLRNPNTTQALVAGTTGSGKTVLMKDMALSLAIHRDPRSLGMILIDPKGLDFPQLSRLPHLVHPVVYNYDQTLVVLNSLIAEMNRRGESVQPQHCNPMEIASLQKQFMPIIVFIDEISSLMSNKNSPAAKMVGRLVAKGRGYGIHLVLGTQKPSAEMISGESMQNLPVRVCGLVGDSEQGKYATGIAGSKLGANKLAGNGDMILTLNGTKAFNFQAGFFDRDEREDIRIVDSIASKWWAGQTNPWRLPIATESSIDVIAVTSASASSERTGAQMTRAQIEQRKNTMKELVRQQVAQKGHIPSYSAVQSMLRASLGAQPNFNTVKAIVNEVQATLPNHVMRTVKPQ